MTTRTTITNATMTDGTPWPDARPFPDEDYRRAVVVAAGPNDAPHAIGGVIQRLVARGTAVTLVTTTTEPDDDPLPGVRVHRLTTPTEHHAELIELLADADACFVPWPGDPDPDRVAIGEAALHAAPRTTHRWSYSVRPWPDRAAVPVSRVFAHRHGGAVEIVFRQPPDRSAPIDRFAELYDEGSDPWGVASRWYERRKRATVLAALPDEHYGSAVEPACGTGVLTEALAERCDRLVAFDPVPAAVREARSRTAHLPHVRVAEGMLPADLPTGPTDLVVFSEILYYLDDADLTSTVDNAVAALRPGGHLLAAHWLPWAAEAPRDGMAAHRVLLADPRLTPIVEHVDARFVLHVLGRR